MSVLNLHTCPYFSQISVRTFLFLEADFIDVVSHLFNPTTVASPGVSSFQKVSPDLFLLSVC